MVISKEEKKAYVKLAVDAAIQYARELGVKLRHSDFTCGITSGVTDGIVSGMEMIGHENNYAYFMGNDEKNGSVQVWIAKNEKRWSVQLKRAQDDFLNYVNARVKKDGIQFSFTVNELNILRSNKEESGTAADGANIERIIDKVKKLLALGDLERNPSEQEAIQASLHAQRLLAKYNLSVADVAGGHEGEEVEQAVADVGAGKEWKYKLSDVVAANYACKAFSYGKEMIIFYGYKADVLIARRVFVYLFKVGNRLANQYVKKWKTEIDHKTSGIYNSFVSGFIDGIRTELEKQCTALALAIQPEVESQWKSFSENFGIREHTIAVNSSYAFNEGFAEGKRALNAQYLEDVTRYLED